MAGDARISTGLPGHPKTKKLLRRLGHAGPWGLVCLFLWAASNRSDGDLSGMSIEDIELAADWQGAEGEFVRALCEVGFLDGEVVGYRIHDWAEHNPWAAGSADRSEASKWAALCKRYGRAGAADRMPDYAERMRPAHEPHATGTKAQCDPGAPSPSPIPLPSPIQKQEKPASPTGSRLPADWSLPADWKDWATKERPDVNAEREAASFADYWHGKPGADARKADWLATWRNWIRRAKPSGGNGMAYVAGGGRRAL